MKPLLNGTGNNLLFFMGLSAEMTHSKDAKVIWLRGIPVPEASGVLHDKKYKILYFYASVFLYLDKIKRWSFHRLTLAELLPKKPEIEHKMIKKLLIFLSVIILPIIFCFLIYNQISEIRKTKNDYKLNSGKIEKFGTTYKIHKGTNKSPKTESEVFFVKLYGNDTLYS